MPRTKYVGITYHPDASGRTGRFHCRRARGLLVVALKTKYDGRKYNAALEFTRVEFNKILRDAGLEIIRRIKGTAREPRLASAHQAYYPPAGFRIVAKQPRLRERSHRPAYRVYAPPVYAIRPSNVPRHQFRAPFRYSAPKPIPRQNQAYRPYYCQRQLRSPIDHQEVVFPPAAPNNQAEFHSSTDLESQVKPPVAPSLAETVNVTKTPETIPNCEESEEDESSNLEETIDLQKEEKNEGRLSEVVEEEEESSSLELSEEEPVERFSKKLEMKEEPKKISKKPEVVIWKKYQLRSKTKTSDLW